jgi:membrane-bound serine protease (ClpP class)
MLTIPSSLFSNLMYLLLVAGVWFASLAVISPGTGLYEVLTLMTLASAGIGLFYTPINAWAFIPLVLGMAIFLSSLWVRKLEGILLGISALLISLGSVYLFQSEWDEPAVHPILAIIVSLSTLGFYWFAIRKTVAAQRMQSVHDPSLVVGQTGVSRTAIEPVGTIYVGGEYWSARSDQVIPAGAWVLVTGRKGLVLSVELIEIPKNQSSNKGEE